MATYLYTRFSPKNRAYQEHLAALQAHTRDAKHFEDQVQGCVPPNEREQFQSLFNTLQSGDTLVIWWFTVFGRDFSQALATKVSGESFIFADFKVAVSLRLL